MKWKNTVIGALALILVVVIVIFAAVPSCRRNWNNYKNELAEIDEETLYKNRKVVEDTCRSMIASYHADVLTYEQYRNSAVAEERGWAEQARMRANRTASSYNDYVLKNSHVWAENIPPDIDKFLITY